MPSSHKLKTSKGFKRLHKYLLTFQELNFKSEKKRKKLQAKSQAKLSELTISLSYKFNIELFSMQTTDIIKSVSN